MSKESRIMVLKNKIHANIQRSRHLPLTPDERKFLEDQRNKLEWELYEIRYDPNVTHTVSQLIERLVGDSV